MAESYFERRSPQIIVPEPRPYDMSNVSDIKACGLDAESFKKRNDIVFDNLDGMEECNPVAFIASKFEDGFSKRELAFLLAKQALRDNINIEKVES